MADRHRYWIVPVGAHNGQAPLAAAQALVVEHHVFGFSEATYRRARLREGDQVAFYAAGAGLTAVATVDEAPGRRPHPVPRYAETHPYVFGLTHVEALEPPRPIDLSIRGQLDAFAGRDLSKPWSWFVQSAHALSGRDFETLTGQAG